VPPRAEVSVQTRKASYWELDSSLCALEPARTQARDTLEEGGHCAA